MQPLRSRAVRVFLCDDSAAFRALLRHTLDEQPDLDVVGEAADGRAGIAGVAETSPDIVLLDLAMPVLNGLKALPGIRAAAPLARVIALSAFSSQTMASAVLAQGGAASLDKALELTEIVAAVSRIAQVPIAG